MNHLFHFLFLAVLPALFLSTPPAFDAIDAGLTSKTVTTYHQWDARNWEHHHDVFVKTEAEETEHFKTSLVHKDVATLSEDTLSSLNGVAAVFYGTDSRILSYLSLLTHSPPAPRA